MNWEAWAHEWALARVCAVIWHQDWRSLRTMTALANWVMTADLEPWGR